LPDAFAYALASVRGWTLLTGDGELRTAPSSRATGWIAPACGWRTYSITSSAICGEFGNILASTFSHAEGCPVDTEEKRSSQRVQK
jgi:hypothetical protein